MTKKTMPIQISGELDLAERRGKRPVLVRSIPWEMIGDDAAERQCQRNHDGQTLERIRQRGGFSAAEAVRVISGLSWDDTRLTIPEKDAHHILYAMLVLFNRGKRVAETKKTAFNTLPDDYEAPH